MTVHQVGSGTDAFMAPAAPNVLFEDDRLIAVDKPAGLVVHPSYKNATGTLLDWLRERESTPVFRILSRLDKLTSGIVIVAKDAETYTTMQRNWRATEKDYLAVVHGRVEPDHGEIHLSIGADPSDRRRRVVSPLAGSPSVTRYERLDYIDHEPLGRSLVRCRLLTGRRHQIRVHLAARGWPILGDEVYGNRPSLARPLPRHALHSWRLSFSHPSSGMRLLLEAPVPPDLRVLFPFRQLPAA